MYIHEIHDDIQKKITLSNENYKAHADLKRKFAELSEGNTVKVHIRPKRFPRKTYKKLHSRNTRPYKILKKISSNAHILNISTDMGISNIFNMEDLNPYAGHENDSPSGRNEANLPPSCQLREEIEDIVGHQIVST